MGSLLCYSEDHSEQLHLFKCPKVEEVIIKRKHRNHRMYKSLNPNQNICYLPARIRKNYPEVLSTARGRRLNALNVFIQRTQCVYSFLHGIALKATVTFRAQIAVLFAEFVGLILHVTFCEEILRFTRLAVSQKYPSCDKN